MNTKENIIIVGAGLSGLTLAYLLSKKGVKATILEGSERIGGRIHTVKGHLETPLELGATWFSNAHKNLQELLLDLNLKKYPQAFDGISLFQTGVNEPIQRFQVPDTDPSFRIVGGTQQLISALEKHIDSKQIYLKKKVVELIENKDELILKTASNETFNAHKVILCLPPELAYGRIHFSPPIDKRITKLLPTVQTWMAGSVKFVIEYSEPFWKKKGLSGALFSHVGIVTEMYDHTNFENNRYGFTGFLNANTASLSTEQRKMHTLNHIKSILGDEALNPVFYEDKVWTNAFVLASTQNLSAKPHNNNGHPLLHQPYYNGKLFFAGTETSTTHPGYMEGAISSAKRILKTLLQ